MRDLKDKVQQKISGKMTIDPALNGRYRNLVLFKHKIDRLKTLFKGTKLDSTGQDS